MIQITSKSSISPHLKSNHVRFNHVNSPAMLAITELGCINQPPAYNEDHHKVFLAYQLSSDRSPNRHGGYRLSPKSHWLCQLAVCTNTHTTDFESIALEFGLRFASGFYFTNCGIEPGLRKAGEFQLFQTLLPVGIHYVDFKVPTINGIRSLLDFSSFTFKSLNRSFCFRYHALQFGIAKSKAHKFPQMLNGLLLAPLLLIGVSQIVMDICQIWIDAQRQLPT